MLSHSQLTSACDLHDVTSLHGSIGNCKDLNKPDVPKERPKFRGDVSYDFYATTTLYHGYIAWHIIKGTRIRETSNEYHYAM